MNDSCLYEILDYIVGPDVKLDYPPPQPAWYLTDMAYRSGNCGFAEPAEAKMPDTEMKEDERKDEREDGMVSASNTNL